MLKALLPLALLIGAFAPAAAAQALAREALQACLAEVKTHATTAGITPEVFDEATRTLEPDDEVLESMDRQPEFSLPVWHYVNMLVDDRRILEGRHKLEEWNRALRVIERDYGVERHVIVAIWGVESNFGKRMGDRPLLRSLATGSCFGRRQAFFRGELLQVLRIIQDGDMRAEDLNGSWAGAFGHTQFMPTTFRRLAVDFDGDGRRDLVRSIPDVLASTANYLRDAGWKRGEPWGYEVQLPKGYEGPSGRRTRKPVGEWKALGIRRADGKQLKGDDNAALLLPAGARGPAFLVFDNFQALYSYNASESYALAIAHLADRMHGRGPFRAPWPTDDPTLDRMQRIELQGRLAALGYDVGEPDGIIGGRTMEAIREFQRASGLVPDGYAGLRLWQVLISTPL